MFTCNRMMIFGAVLVAFLAYADAFFWGGSHEEQKQQQVYAYPISSIYQQRFAQHQLQPQLQQLQQPNGNPNGEQHLGQQVPAIPIQVPLNAQFSPIQNLHNVQLVPCLCPVTPNVEYERIQEQQ